MLIFSCENKKNLKPIYMENGRSSRFLEFTLSNDTLNIFLDTIANSILNSDIQGQIIFWPEKYDVTFSAKVKQVQVDNSNCLRIPISNFELINRASSLDTLEWEKSDSLIKCVQLGRSCFKNCSSINIELLDVHFSSLDPSFRKENEDYIPEYFCRFRTSYDTVVIEQNYDLYILKYEN